MEATLTFATRDLAQEFATRWTFFSKTGHTIGAGTENVKVRITDLNDEKIAWVNNYVNSLNA